MVSENIVYSNNIYNKIMWLHDLKITNMGM